ncbi:membrane-bound ATP synthase subunit, F1-F0-type proton-ATPase [Pseudoalteromonas luteoviolacea B = ATCC 29581]|nr:membrane-bound ATP synthase subunit, F1-F0-type proton-ATPase [Pseudoalteromonas luteoviolacea B = ATCC 29581]
MTDRLARPLQLSALKLVLFQACIVLICAVFVLVCWGVTAGLSALLGGLTAVLPNFLFSLYAFRFVGASKTEQVYASFKRGSGLKFLLTVLLFGACFKFIAISALPFFVVYIIALFAIWSAPIFFH